ncbi:MAG: hypothetical protein R3234_11165, partial [Thermoanaerobaculia bacterium]|nr:hypothetical protein [Thermoanaerobaculia bacterium]
MNRDSASSQGTDPVLRQPEETELTSDRLQELRRFHWSSEDAPEGGLEPGILPASLHPYRNRPVRSDFPLFVASSDDDPVLCRSLPALLEELASDVESRPVRDNLPRLEAAIREAVGGSAEFPEAGSVLREAADSVLGELDLGESEEESWSEALTGMVEALPPDGVFLPLRSTTSLELLAAVARNRMVRARRSFLPEVRELADTAELLLQADREAREGREPGALRAAMGALGGRFVDSEAFSGLSRRRGGRELSEPRRLRLREAKESLTSFLESPDQGRILGRAPTSLEIDGWTLSRPDDVCSAAVEAFDEEAESVARLLRAMRRIRLEARGELEPDRHGPWLESLSWEGFDRDELGLIPPVVAVTTPGALASGEMPSLSRLLLSGRPVQVVVLVDPLEIDPTEGEDGDTVASYRFEPAFLALAHREAFVQQVSVSRPEELLEGFRRGLTATRSAVHVLDVVSSEAPEEIDPWLRLSSAVEGRLHPLFLFDPEAGGSWARRLVFRGNPARESDWVDHTIRVRRPGGTEETLSVPYTAADSLLLSPRAADRFFPIDGSHDDLVPLAEWLDLEADEAATRIPFLRAADRKGRLRRIAVTRRVAVAARDRVSFWRTLQELAGIRNEHVDAAARRAREETLATAKEEWETIRARHAE